MERRHFLAGAFVSADAGVIGSGQIRSNTATRPAVIKTGGNRMIPIADGKYRVWTRCVGDSNGRFIWTRAIQTGTALRTGMGGFRMVRVWHFAAMLGLVSFIPGHLIMVAVHGWSNFYSMLTGWKQDPELVALPSEKT